MVMVAEMVGAILASGIPCNIFRPPATNGHKPPRAGLFTKTFSLNALAELL